MNHPNLTLLEAVVRLLLPLLADLVFVGGCATGLFISDSAAEGIRPTTVIDGRPEIVEEVRTAPSDVRQYVASETRRLLATGRFGDALPGFLLPDPATQARLPLLRDRLTAVAGADAS